MYFLLPAFAWAQFRPYYEGGQGVAPVYEGYQENTDGSYTMFFGYMNENWEEELFVPIGASNAFSPGPADRGQPTRFLPRRNRMVFSVDVPADFGGQELEWTLITREGVTQKAYGSLRKDYVLEPITVQSEAGTVAGGRENGEKHSLSRWKSRDGSVGHSCAARPWRLYRAHGRHSERGGGLPEKQ